MTATLTSPTTAISPVLHRKLEKTFDLMDVNHSGFVDANDVEAMTERLAQQAGVPMNSPRLREVRACLTQYWQSLDEDNNGRLTRDEYIAAMIRLASDPQRLRQILEPGNRAMLAIFDSDGDGKITRAEHARMYQDSGMSLAERDQAFRTLDQDNDGYVTVDEFVNASIEYYHNDDPQHPANVLFGAV